MMRAMDIEFLATGHYARIVQRDGVNHLAKAADSRKDQSYFLYRLNSEQLAHILFPLAEYTKEQVRAMAKERRLPVAQKKESQEICFVPDDLRSFLAPRLGSRPGDVVDTDGNVLARHDGVHYFTIGQRKGLGIGTEHVRYVVALDAENARVIVGSRKQAMAKGCCLTDCIFPAGLPAEKQIRRPGAIPLARSEGAGPRSKATRSYWNSRSRNSPSPPASRRCCTTTTSSIGGGIIESVVT